MFGTILENVVLDEQTRRRCSSRTRASPRTRARRTRCTTSRTSCRAAAAGTRRTSSSSPPMRSACCRRSRSSRASRRCTTSSPATRRRSPARSAASRSRQATFSACFGARVPRVASDTKYAEMLGKLIDEHGCTVWLVNTGWSGGRLRRRQAHEARRTRARWCTRSSTARSTRSPTRVDPVFGLAVPTAVPGGARRGARPARHLARPGRLRRAGEEARRRCSATNFEKFGSLVADAVIRAAGPQGLAQLRHSQYCGTTELRNYEWHADDTGSWRSLRFTTSVNRFHERFGTGT